jgi:hypothetical protein
VTQVSSLGKILDREKKRKAGEMVGLALPQNPD